MRAQPVADSTRFTDRTDPNRTQRIAPLSTFPAFDLFWLVCKTPATYDCLPFIFTNVPAIFFEAQAYYFLIFEHKSWPTRFVAFALSARARKPARRKRQQKVTIIESESEPSSSEDELIVRRKKKRRARKAPASPAPTLTPEQVRLQHEHERILMLSRQMDYGGLTC